MKRIPGATVTTTHDYEIQYKYAWVSSWEMSLKTLFPSIMHHLTVCADRLTGVYHAKSHHHTVAMLNPIITAANESPQVAAAIADVDEDSPTSSEVSLGVSE